jgi:hypothetical protein
MIINRALILRKSLSFDPIYIFIAQAYQLENLRIPMGSSGGGNNSRYINILMANYIIETHFIKFY